MLTMRFGKKTFARGLNTTCRNGSDWMRKLNGGTRFILADTEGNRFGEATVVFSGGGTFNAQSEIWIRHNHDPEARTVEGLANAMDTAYQDVWNPTSVSTIGFVVETIDEVSKITNCRVLDGIEQFDVEGGLPFPRTETTLEG